jgi:ATP-dependent helicase/nuclease subunit A
MSRLPVPKQTSLDQASASDPSASAWVSANAGSGKTTVLVRRVKRLLLAGTPPGRILSLTFTEAAAANMANRLFRDLSEWVGADETKLAELLTETLERAPTAAERLRARRLFAEALETPGGLRFETIHGFCTRLLQAAPLEAGVPPRFRVLSDADKDELLAAAISDTLRAADDEDTGLLAHDLDGLLLRVTGDELSDLMGRALKLSGFLLDEAGQSRPRDQLVADLEAALGADALANPDQLTAEAVDAIERLVTFAELAQAYEMHAPKSKTTGKLRDRLRLVGGWTAPERFAVWEQLFLTGEGEARAKIAEAPVAKARPDLVTRLEEARKVLIAARDRIALAETGAATLALWHVAGLVILRYSALKRQEGGLDFDDMIACAREVLTRVQAPWLLYRLDGQLDHLLVDEAQDNSEDQWAILNALTHEFVAGRGQRELVDARTLFVVGDEKQSIFGFQGAAPEAFDRQLRATRTAVRGAGQHFWDVTLKLSFRSAPDILAAVDAVFSQPAAFEGLSFDPALSSTVHESYRAGATGAVDIWPLISKETPENRRVDLRPVDSPERDDAVRKLAEAIAAMLAGWMATGRDDRGEPFHPGDVLILARTRSKLFHAIIRALKQADVPVSGVDRLAVSEHLAVRDLLVIADAAALPEDDLALATALKTPLFGFDDDDLMRLAPNRAGSLRAALAGSGAARDIAADARLRALEELAETGGPVRFFGHLLSAMGGRKALLARLGPEAGDALDALMEEALTHEKGAGGALTTFVAGMRASKREVKRDLSRPSGEVRVMTIHGAKGLEARTVILADLGPRPTGHGRDPFLALRLSDGREAPIWTPTTPKTGKPLVDGEARALAARRQEHNRLLYVAMTRAEDRLIVCGVKGVKESDEGSWWRLIGDGLARSDQLDGQPVPCPLGGDAVRYVVKERAAATTVERKVEATPSRTVTKPAWLDQPAPREGQPLPPLSPARALGLVAAPSRAGDAEALASAAEAGRLAHRLLQWLPEIAAERRAEAARRIAARHGGLLGAPERDRLIAQVLAVMADPAHAALFGPGSRAEVDIAGHVRLGDGRERLVAGRVDRLLVTAGEVVIADYKTASRPPQHPPDSALIQLALYREVLRAAFPQRTIATMLVYTAGLVSFRPDDTLLDRALLRLGADENGQGGLTGS